MSLTKGIRGLLLSRWPAADPTVYRRDRRRSPPLARRRSHVRADDALGHGRAPPRVAGAGARRGLRPGAARDPGRGRALRGPGAGPAGRPGACDGALLVLLGRPGGSSPRPRPAASTVPPTAGRRGRRPASRRRWWATSCGWGPSSTRRGSSGFYRSQDAGASWTRLAASPGRPSRLMFPLAPAAGLEAFLATDRGLFRTTDAGRALVAGGVRRPGRSSPSPRSRLPSPPRGRSGSDEVHEGPRPGQRLRPGRRRGRARGPLRVGGAAVRPPPRDRRRRCRPARAARRTVSRSGSSTPTASWARSRATACAASPRSPCGAAGRPRATS